LATKFYSHFTAPIRRYPDLVIHRILKKYLKGKLKGTDTKTYLQRLDRIAEHTSMTERRADEAEREVDDMKKAEYMSQFIGDDFEGTISGVTSFGFFVALDNTVEGFVSVRDRPDDVYSFDEENYRLVGERTGRTFELGMRGQVRLLAASAETRRIDFQWNGDAN
jgi:ribonuclease R